jgi:hypothetical protein
MYSFLHFPLLNSSPKPITLPETAWEGDKSILVDKFGKEKTNELAVL